MLFLNPFYFGLGLTAGLIYIYITSTKTRQVVLYPTPENAGKVTYVDDAGVCYRYRVKKVECPVDTSMVKDMPVQI